MANSTWWRARRSQFLNLRDTDDLTAVEDLIKRCAAEIDSTTLDFHQLMGREQEFLQNPDPNYPIGDTESEHPDPLFIWLAALKKHNQGRESYVLNDFSAREGNSIDSLCRASADLCTRYACSAERWESDEKLIRPATEGVFVSTTGTPGAGSAIGKKIDELRRECGWSLNDFEKKTGLDKKLIRGHLSGKGMHPQTLKTYADAFSKEFKRKVTVAELRGSEGPTQ